MQVISINLSGRLAGFEVSIYLCDRGGGFEPDFPDFLDFPHFLKFLPSLLSLTHPIYKECAREYMNKTILSSEKTKP